MPSGYGYPSYDVTGQLEPDVTSNYQFQYGLRGTYRATLQGLIDQGDSLISVPASTSDGAGCMDLGCHTGSRVYICNNVSTPNLWRLSLFSSLLPCDRGSANIFSLRTLIPYHPAQSRSPFWAFRWWQAVLLRLTIKPAGLLVNGLRMLAGTLFLAVMVKMIRCANDMIQVKVYPTAGRNGISLRNIIELLIHLPLFLKSLL